MSFVPKIVRLFHEFVVDAIFAPPLFLTFFIFFIDSLQTFFEMAFSPIFTKMGHSQHLFLYFCLFNTVDSKQMFYIKVIKVVCRWLDSNRRSLVWEATALPTEPQPLPFLLSWTGGEFTVAAALVIWTTFSTSRTFTKIGANLTVELWRLSS